MWPLKVKYSSHWSVIRLTSSIVLKIPVTTVKTLYVTVLRDMADKGIITAGDDGFYRNLVCSFYYFLSDKDLVISEFL